MSLDDVILKCSIEKTTIERNDVLVNWTFVVWRITRGCHYKLWSTVKAVWRLWFHKRPQTNKCTRCSGHKQAQMKKLICRRVLHGARVTKILVWKITVLVGNLYFHKVVHKSSLNASYIKDKNRNVLPLKHRTHSEPETCLEARELEQPFLGKCFDIVVENKNVVLSNWTVNASKLATGVQH